MAALDTGGSELLFGFDKDANSHLFNIFQDRIMSDALEDHYGSVSIGGRIFIRFRLAGDIVVNAQEEMEAGDVVTSMDTNCTRYKVEFGPDKTKIMSHTIQMAVMDI